VSAPVLAAAGFELDGRWLVRDVSLALTRGRLTALLGPNGSGKTTVLRLFAGLWTPTAGRATLDDRPLARSNRRVLATRVTFVPQDTHVGFAFTVRDIVAMGRHPHVGRFERERESDRQAVLDAMARADVSHLADRLVTELSGGERQRVLIARSLATEAETILLDEPIANLDIAHAIDVLTLCRALTRQHHAVVIALHDINAALRYADDAVLLKDGRVAASGPTSDVLRPDVIRDVFDVEVERYASDRAQPLFGFARGTASGER